MAALEEGHNRESIPLTTTPQRLFRRCDLLLGAVERVDNVHEAHVRD